MPPPVRSILLKFRHRTIPTTTIMTSASSKPPALGPLLSTIHSPDDVKKLADEDLTKLAEEIRETLISSLSKTGGHLGPNLGVVELSVALHRVFSTPRDK